MEYLCLVVKLLIGFFLIISYLFVSGKTKVSQMTSVDLVGNFIMGGLIGGALYNNDMHIYAYVLALLISLTMLFIINRITHKIEKLKSIVVGNPIPIIKSGHFIMDNVDSSKIDLMNIVSQLRTNGILSFKDVQFAQIEPSGQVSVVAKDQNENLPGIILVHNGKILSHDICDILGKDEEWFRNAMESMIDNSSKIEEVGDILIAEFWRNKIYFYLKNGDVIIRDVTLN